MSINALLINLPKRKERLVNSEKELNNFFGSLGNVTVINGIDMIENTTLAVREAHKKCVYHAKENDFDNVLIIEDDIKLRENSFEYFTELLKNFPLDFDVLVFGIYSGKIYETKNKHWDEVEKFSGLHFYVVNKNSYDKILNYNGNIPIDHWIGQNLKCYISKKHFAYQLDGFSDNAKTVTNYNTTNLLQYKKYFF